MSGESGSDGQGGSEPTEVSACALACEDRDPLDIPVPTEEEEASVCNDDVVEAALAENWEFVMRSLENDFPVDWQYRGNTVLHWAAYSRHLPTLKLALSLGADPNIAGPGNLTALHFSFVEAESESLTPTSTIIAELIARGADVNAFPEDSPNCLMATCREGGPLDRLHTLLGAESLDIRLTFQGRSAVDFARDAGHAYVADLVEEVARRRERWTLLRVAWVSGVARASLARQRQRPQQVVASVSNSQGLKKLCTHAA